MHVQSWLQKGTVAPEIWSFFHLIMLYSFISPLELKLGSKSQTQTRFKRNAGPVWEVQLDGSCRSEFQVNAGGSSSCIPRGCMVLMIWGICSRFIKKKMRSPVFRDTGNILRAVEPDASCSSDANLSSKAWPCWPGTNVGLFFAMGTKASDAWLNHGASFIRSCCSFEQLGALHKAQEVSVHVCWLIVFLYATSLVPPRVVVLVCQWKFGFQVMLKHQRAGGTAATGHGLGGCRMEGPGAGKGHVLACNS